MPNITMDMITENIREHLYRYIKNHNIQSLVIGVSGGIDSAVCCALAELVCSHADIPLIGRSLPIESNTDEEQQRAVLIGSYFCNDFKVILTLPYQQFIEHCNIYSEPDELQMKIRLGNIKARVRMIYLYDLAQKHKGMILSTDNYTEYMLGFWTLHGDVGDYGMIQNLWKTEVYKLAEHLRNDISTCPTNNHRTALWECIQAIPTDGLGITNSDLDQIGADTYEEVDELLKRFLNGEGMLDSHPVIQRHLKSEFKRINPFNISRKDIFR